MPGVHVVEENLSNIDLPLVPLDPRRMDKSVQRQVIAKITDRMERLLADYVISFGMEFRSGSQSGQKGIAKKQQYIFHVKCCGFMNSSYVGAGAK